MKFNEWAEEWLQAIKPQVKQRTYFSYKETVEKHILPYFIDKDLNEITVNDIREVIREKQQSGNMVNGKGLSSNSVNLIITLIKEIFKSAYEEELTDKNPADRIKRVRTAEREIEAFNLKEEKKIRDYILNSGDCRLIGILLAMDTGMRIGEILALTWEDIDLKRGVITVRKTRFRMKRESGVYEDIVDVPKTKSSFREIPVLPNVILKLRRLKGEKRGVYVVTNKKGDKMSIRSYQYIFKRIQEKVGIKVRNFHCLRHTFATRAIESGVDIKTVSELLGHRNASLTVNRYAHSMWETKKKAVIKIFRRISGYCV